MNFLDLAKKRFSVRSYSTEPVSQEELNLILEAAQVAPTACNNQPFHILAVQSKEVLAKISKSTNFYNAPLVLIILGDNSQAWTREYDNYKATDIDASIATDHMMLQATALGLGSLWICYFDPEILRNELNIPSNLRPINILAIGHNSGNIQAPDRHSTKRKQINELVSYDYL